MPMVASTKVSGMTTSNPEKDSKSLVTTLSIRETTLEANQRGAVAMSGKTANFMKVNGLMGSNTVREFGEGPKETLILVSGGKEKLMGMAYTLGLMETGMKVSLRIA